MLVWDAHIDSLQDGTLQALVLLRGPAGVPEGVRQVLECGGRLQRVLVGLRHAAVGHPEAAGACHARLRIAPYRVGRLCATPGQPSKHACACPAWGHVSHGPCPCSRIFSSGPWCRFYHESVGRELVDLWATGGFCTGSATTI